MAGIRAKDTAPELTIRRGLHAMGYRYRLHSASTPGKPDLLLPRWRSAIFVNGCFWHGHDCHLFRMPSTRKDFWRAKITRNVARDKEVATMLASDGWRALTVWECAMKGRTRLRREEVLARVDAWLRGDSRHGDIRGTE